MSHSGGIYLQEAGLAAPRLPRVERELLQEAWSTEGVQVWLVVLLEQFALTMHHEAGMVQRGICSKPGSPASALSLGYCPVFQLQHLILHWLGFVSSLWLLSRHHVLASAARYRKVHLLLSYKPPTPLVTCSL